MRCDTMKQNKKTIKTLQKEKDTEVEELECFLTNAYSNNQDTYCISIPKQISTHLNFKEHKELIEIAIRKISEEEAVERYKSLPMIHSKYGNINIVTCPKCGKQGRVHIRAMGKSYAINIYHNSKESCYIGRPNVIDACYPEIYQVYLKMMEMRKEQQ